MQRLGTQGGCLAPEDTEGDILLLADSYSSGPMHLLFSTHCGHKGTNQEKARGCLRGFAIRRVDKGLAGLLGQSGALEV